MNTRKRGVAGGREIPLAKAGELYSLKWDSYHTHITQGLQRFFSESDALKDVTVGSEGQYIRSHKLVLSLCSPYFKQLFESNRADLLGNTVVMLEHIKFKDLKNVMKFIYNGEIKVSTSDLTGFLEAGELLQIQGLKKADDDDETTTTKKATATPKRSLDDRSIPQVLLKRMKDAGHPNCSSSSKPHLSRRRRLGQVIKPAAVSSSSFDCDADDSNFSIGDVEEIEPDLIALDSTALEDNGLNDVEGIGTSADSGYEVVIVPSVNMKMETMEQEYQDADHSANSNVDQFLQEEGIYNTTYHYEEGQGDQEGAGPSLAVAVAGGAGADIDVSQQTKTPGMVLTMSRKGKPLMYYEGNHYRLESCGGSKKRYWACLKHRHTKCPGRLSTSKDMLELIDITGKHTHGGESLQCYGRVESM